MFNDLITALENTGYQFAHFAWSSAPDGDYGIYAEYSGADFIADDQHTERGTVCYVSYYTRDDSVTPRTTIENVFNSLGIPWYLNTVQYENDTGYIHYEWELGIYG